NEEGFPRDAIQALRRLRAPVLRWPGGCFADTYHWKDGVGPAERRPKQWNLWWSNMNPTPWAQMSSFVFAA
ncbi:MAG TPA: hypothetical protein VHP35_16500, partial [Terriglobia bacterium]|nr:hypothetical protein [Terriglobia bacterium]